MKIIRSAFLLLATSFMAFYSASIGNKVDTKYIVVSAGNETVSEYYSSITDSMSGDTLLTALNTLNNQKRKNLVTYAGMRQAAAVFDADPDGSGKVVGFYDNELVGPAWDSAATWNREHVWPNVRGGSLVEGDAHMTRPASTKTNSDRGSKGYGTASYDPGQFVAYYRGAASRIIFYAAIADLNLKLVDDPLNYHGGTPKNSMGSLSEMLKWNLEYQPSDTSFTGANDLARRTEINRNNQIQIASIGQGNRNPFIDHPEYACRIWGNTNNATREICKNNQGGGQTTPDTPDTPENPDIPDTPDTPTPTKVELEKIEFYIHEKEIDVGEKFMLKVKLTPENAIEVPSFTYYSTDKSVAKIENDSLVTGLANGTCEIVVASDDLRYTDRLTVIVGTGKKDNGQSNSGCGGTIVATSIFLSTISLLGISLLLLRKLKK